MTDIGARIRQLRWAASHTQATLALVINEQRGTKWTQGTISKIEQNRRNLTLPEAETLAALFGMPLQDMLYGHNQQQLQSEVCRAKAISLQFIEQALLMRLKEVRAELAQLPNP